MQLKITILGHQVAPKADALRNKLTWWAMHCLPPLEACWQEDNASLNSLEPTQEATVVISSSPTTRALHNLHKAVFGEWLSRINIALANQCQRWIQVPASNNSPCVNFPLSPPRKNIFTSASMPSGCGCDWSRSAQKSTLRLTFGKSTHHHHQHHQGSCLLPQTGLATTSSIYIPATTVRQPSPESIFSQD